MVNFDDSLLANMRSEFQHNGFDIKDARANPIDQFEVWFSEANQVYEMDANVMTLATSTADGKPSARIVLLKQIIDSGFVFYTNYLSRKGREIKMNDQGALLFYWAGLGRQVRIEGQIHKISQKDSFLYFHSRPRESQIAAWASMQSKKLKNRAELEESFDRLNNKYKDIDIPIPDFWGGYCLIPNRFEFWQGRANRLHDRIEYVKDLSNDKWLINRLAP
jgi:pyridoxamine 5'-phosphate oxidase